MELNEIKDKIVYWLKAQNNESGLNGFVVGISGGVDSGTVSTLCAETGLKTIVVSMPINHQFKQFGHDLSLEHASWLVSKYPNVEHRIIDLTDSFEQLSKDANITDELSSANSRSRLRMIALYSVANSNKLLVAGTGNKVEDYGVGFFTKYGDGGVDISPIGDLTKTQVRELAKYLDVSDSIVNAVPTDGLWGDSRSDEDQIGVTYEELEWAMSMYSEALGYYDMTKVAASGKLTEKQFNIMKIFFDRHKSNSHKMNMPPVCKLF